MTPFRGRADGGGPLASREKEFNPPRPPFLKHHSSTPSNDSLGRKIQRHLDAGNPLYIGFDPANPPRDSTLAGQARAGDADRGANGEEHTTAGRRKGRGWRVARVLSCGVPLDIYAKIILATGMILALSSLLWSINRLIQRKGVMGRDNLTIFSYMIIFHCIWGVILFATCFFGFILMWGKWRRSPTAALFFTLTWILITILLLLTSVLWLYFYFHLRDRSFTRCSEKTTSTGPAFDRDAPVRQATKTQIDNCLLRRRTRAGEILPWGIAYTLMSYAGIIVALWGMDYRRRLLEIRECEELEKGPGAEGEKVGLLLGTAPLGRLAHSRRMIIGPRKSELEVSSVEEGQRPRDTIVRFSGTVRVGEAAPTSPSSHGRHRDRKGSDSSVESLGLGISVEGQSFVGNSSQGRGMAY
ncbi:unnamed protein product [Tuber aestivum]|uniref:Uncharacterized protein n=1 Tax=Tuber aestivum TaxID=59557 RepID=A0A292Q0K6_9PEZI|nr:unnamed protein product [Tuber aestivum]